MSGTALPAPHYIDLRTPTGKLLARYDPARGILEMAERGTRYYFDLALLRLQKIDEPTETGYNFDR